jgi:DMSO/TMAO reductase YedYZ molybdopterin-dependent catalytic subunit
MLARTRPKAAIGVVLGLGAVAAVAAGTRPDASVSSVLPSVVGGLAGAAALNFLARRGADRTDQDQGETVPATPTPGQQRAGWYEPSGSAISLPMSRPTSLPTSRAAGPPGREEGPAAVIRPGLGPDRRGLLVAAGGLAAAGLISGGAGWVLGRHLHAAEESRAAVRLPAPAEPEPALPAGVSVGVPGVTPFRVTNGSFYRIDTALLTPQVKAKGWTLRLHGMVDREVRLNFAQLMASPLVEHDVTLTCVSNEVGGNLIGNARWLGLPLGPLLRQAGPHPEADMVLSTSADGWTASTPLAVLLDGRMAMLAVGMNGEPLPIQHGFPVRMVVPGLYGYVSATKWVVDLEVTRFDRATGYWTTRGWSDHGPVKTESRIDVPGDGSRVRAGRVAVAGVAWAQHRGIRAVEVRVDDGSWQPARLAEVPSADTWRQWVLPWDATPGTHRLQVRATDETGAVQTGEQAPPEPNGATGWHTIQVNVH